jgi:hypothetical protein
MPKTSVRWLASVAGSEELRGSGGEGASPGVELTEELEISTGIEVFTQWR